MAIEILHAGQADLPDLARLHGSVQTFHAQMCPDFFRDGCTASFLEEYWRDQLAAKTSTIAIAKQAGKAAGYIWFELQQRPQDEMRQAMRRIYVHHIGVAINAKRCGIGTALLAFAEAEARRLGITAISLDTWAANGPAQKFFKACGYDPVNIVLTKTL